MAGRGPCVRAGYINSITWPNAVYYSLSRPDPICDRLSAEEEGLLSEGPRGVICNIDLLNAAWVALEDLQKPITPHKLVEESLQYYRAFYPDELVPQDLHSELLEEALHVEVAASKASLLGNRLASTWLGNELLVCSPCGKIGETLKLSVVSDSNEDKNQCGNVAHAACSGMPIWQIAFNRPPAEDGDALRVAVRTPYWLCFFSVGRTQGHPDQEQRQDGPSAGEEAAWHWALQPVGALQTRQRLAHICWNRCLPTLIAFTCEDGSLHTVDVSQKMQCRSTAGLGSGKFALLCANEVAGPSPLLQRGRLLCEWGVHPTRLLHAAGEQLLQYQIKGRGPAGAPQRLHRLEEGDAFVAIGGADGPSGSGDAGQNHLLAASTLREVLLLDLRRPGQALLRWQHGMKREPPQLLSLLPGLHSRGAECPQHCASGQHPAGSQPAQMKQEGQKGKISHQRAFMSELQQGQADLLQSQHGSSSQLPDQWPAPATQQQRLGTQASQQGAHLPLPSQGQFLGTQASQAAVPQHRSARRNAPQTAASGAAGHQGQTSRSMLCGVVAAANFGAGDALSFAFGLPSQRAALRAQPPAEQHHESRPAPLAAFGSIRAYGPPSTAQAPMGSQDRQQNGRDTAAGNGSATAAGAEAQGGGFSWTLRSGAGVQSLGLPRRICWPLQLHRRPEDALAGVASPEAAKQLEAVLKDAPDLQGIAFVAAPPDHPAAADGSKAGRLEQPPRDRVLMLRLDFLGHVHVERMRFPWLARADAQGPALKEGSVAPQPLSGMDSSYLIAQGCGASSTEAERQETDKLSRTERRRLLRHLEQDLICDLKIHHGIAQKALQDWRNHAGDYLDAEPGISQSVDSELLSQLMASTKVPLTLWEACMELQRLQKDQAAEVSEGTGGLSPTRQPGRAASACLEQSAVALRRRIWCVRQGLQAVEMGKGAQGRLTKWEKARTDMHNIMTEFFLDANREVREGAPGMPSQVRETASALSAAIAQADLPSREDHYALIEGPCRPPSNGLLTPGNREPCQQTEEWAPDSQATTASQGTSAATSEGAATISRGPPVDRVLGNGMILMPQTQLKPFFGASVKGGVTEPELIMQKVEVKDFLAAEALSELERDWLAAEGKLLDRDSAPIRTVANQTDDQGRRDGPASIKEPAQGTEQRRVSFAPETSFAAKLNPPARQPKKRRVALEEGFS